MQIKNFINTVINFIFSLLLSFSMVYALTTSLLFEYKAYIILGMIFFITVIYSVMFFNRISTIVSLSVVSLCLLIYAAYLNLGNHARYFLDFINEYTTWLYYFMLGKAQINQAYQFYTTLALCIAVTLLVFFFTVKKFSFFIILAGGICLFTVQWAYEFFVSYAAFYIFIFTAIIYYLKYIYSKKSSGELNDYTPPFVFNAYIIPVCAVILGISLFLPVSSKPIDWPWLDARFNDIYDFFSKKDIPVSIFDYFSIQSTGFGENNELGGNVRLDKTLVLSVESSSSNVYLKGSCKDFYSGSSWLPTDRRFFPYDNTDNEKVDLSSAIDIPSPKLDVLEMTKGPKFLTNDKDFLNKVSSKNYIKITFNNLKTKTLFTPLKTQKINFFNEKTFAPYFNANSIFSLRDTQVKKFNYSVNYTEVKYNDETFKNMLRKSHQNLYLEYRVKVNEQNGNASSGSSASNSLNIYEPYFNNDVVPTKELSGINYFDYMTLYFHSVNIHNTYLQLPFSIPERVVTLSQSVTSQYTNDYDKVKAIEQYLAKNYPYTLNPGPTPKDRDFVDYFLFENKQGYCTYYASAMTILVRCIGIPARYVEGYILPPVPAYADMYEVTNQQAHAWVEVYFEGFGWVPFEPTAPFTGNFYRNNDFEPTFGQGFLNNPDYQEYIKKLQQRSYVPDIPTSKEATNPSLGSHIALILACTFIVLLLILSCLLTVHIIKLKIQFRKILSSDARNCILSLYQYYLKLYSIQGLPILSGETPLQFAERIEGKNPLTRESNQITFTKVTHVFLMARFSANEIDNADKDLVYEFHDKLVNHTKTSIGKFKFFIKRYFLGRL